MFDDTDHTPYRTCLSRTDTDYSGGSPNVHRKLYTDMEEPKTSRIKYYQTNNLK